MRNCLILGSGRSGTSMLAGMLHEAGYFMGDRLHKPRDTNPKGFFEWYRINRINEQILEPYDRPTPYSRIIRAALGKHTVRAPGMNQRWLMSIPPMTDIGPAAPAIEREIREVAARAPFCYKDPRFCYTLPAWKPLLPSGTAYLCVFREPDVTVRSIMKECASAPYLSDMRMTRSGAYEVWSAMYARVLDRLVPLCGEDLVLLHYDQVLSGAATPGLRRFLEADITGDFADHGLKRTKADGGPTRRARELYRRLCEKAGYES